MTSRKFSVMLSFLVVLLLAATACADQAKYVFFFLGDGMSSAQIQAAEAYKTTINGGKATEAADLLKSENRLNLSRLPVAGMQTTYDAHALMTDSASAGTAFACGIKTRSGTIGQDNPLDNPMPKCYKSVAQLAHERGKKVGVITSVSLDHATPASYFASVPDRGLMNNIATQLAESGYEFFGGGGLVSPTKKNKDGDTENDVWSILSDKGYSVFKDNAADCLNLKEQPLAKVVCINPWLQDSSAMPYDIDRVYREYNDPTYTNRNLSLAQMTEVAIANLYKLSGRGKGFFIMVEGGKIDWSCHANDAIATIGDMLDFDNAVGVALEFYKRHPHETLIVVTGDHETGGMTIGHATTAYTAYYDRLIGQKNSFVYFGQVQLANYRTTHSCGGDIDDEMKGLVSSVFGLNWNELNDYQRSKLEEAYDRTMCGLDNSDSNKKYVNNLLYGGYDPLTVTITHILNERASIGWTSYSHTGVPVPVFAVGRNAERFAGFYDNTDIAKQLARAMGIRRELPVLK